MRETHTPALHLHWFTHSPSTLPPFLFFVDQLPVPETAPSLFFLLLLLLSERRRGREIQRLRPRMVARPKRPHGSRYIFFFSCPEKPLHLSSPVLYFIRTSASHLSRIPMLPLVSLLFLFPSLPPSFPPTPGPLHALNPVRVRYILNKCGRSLNAPSSTSASSSSSSSSTSGATTTKKTLRGVRILDVGCGGGLLTEALAR